MGMGRKEGGGLAPQTNYQTALDLGREKLAALDFDRQCEKAGLIPGPEGAAVRLVNRDYFVSRNSFLVTPRDGGPRPELWEQIIILHYLLHADGALPAGDLITYQSVPDGAPYYPVFQRRTTAILLSAFSENLEAILSAAQKLGAVEIQGHGDFAFLIPALPRAGFVFVAYRGEDGLPPARPIMMDQYVPNNIPAQCKNRLFQIICF
jgi:hypothetical protein